MDVDNSFQGAVYSILRHNCEELYRDHMEDPKTKLYYQWTIEIGQTKW
jgi:hypothetical protein